jgi:hypothetical protein
LVGLFFVLILVHIRWCVAPTCCHFHVYSVNHQEGRLIILTKKNLYFSTYGICQFHARIDMTTIVICIWSYQNHHLSYLSICIHSYLNFLLFLSRIKDGDCKKHGELKDMVIFIDVIFLVLLNPMQKRRAHLFSISEPSH